MFMEKKLSHKRSKNNFREAKKVLPDGGSRSTISLAPHSIYAESASGIMIDLDSNEILAMTNFPSFDPNNRKKLKNMELLKNNLLFK